MNKSIGFLFPFNKRIHQFLYSFSLELFAKPTIKTIEESTIKASIVKLRLISSAIKAKKKMS